MFEYEEGELPRCVLLDPNLVDLSNILHAIHPNRNPIPRRYDRHRIQRFNDPNLQLKRT